LFIFSLVVLPAALIVVYLVGVVEGRRDITIDRDRANATNTRKQVDQRPPPGNSRRRNVAVEALVVVGSLMLCVEIFATWMVCCPPSLSR
jgi:hypothetical protein